MTKRESLDETPSPDGNGILFYFFLMLRLIWQTKRSEKQKRYSGQRD